MKKFWLVITMMVLSVVLLVYLHPRSGSEKKDTGAPLPPQFTEKSLFLTPIHQSSSISEVGKVTGITVPHHLLARDLIADMFVRLQGQTYDRIVVISPDHFWLGYTTISVADQDFATILGLLKTDYTVVEKLIDVPEVSTADFFYREHGVQAELPFIAYFFPHTPIVAIAVKENARQEELDLLINKLKKVLTKNTLIVQSTDFSHYLPVDVANTKDIETIEVLKGNNPEKVLELTQPDHMDSKAAQYIQSRLQKEFFKSDLTIVAHRNSQYYTDEVVEETTSYITQMYKRN